VLSNRSHKIGFLDYLIFDLKTFGIGMVLLVPLVIQPTDDWLLNLGLGFLEGIGGSFFLALLEYATGWPKIAPQRKVHKESDHPS
jgi:hypothetical protein